MITCENPCKATCKYILYIYICMYLYVSKIVHILYHFLYLLVFALARFLLMDTLFNCRSVSEGLRWLRPARRMPRSLRYKARDSQQWKVSCELSVSDFFLASRNEIRTWTEITDRRLDDASRWVSHRIFQDHATLFTRFTISFDLFWSLGKRGRHQILQRLCEECCLWGNQYLVSISSTSDWTESDPLFPHSLPTSPENFLALTSGVPRKGTTSALWRLWDRHLLPFAKKGRLQRPSRSGIQALKSTNRTRQNSWNSLCAGFACVYNDTTSDADACRI